MYNHNLGSSFGGCYSPKNYTVKDPTAHSSQFFGTSGSKQGGYYHSPIETRQENRYYWVDGKKKYY